MQIYFNFSEQLAMCMVNRLAESQSMKELYDIPPEEPQTNKHRYFLVI